MPRESSVEGIVLMSDLEQGVMVPHDAIIEYSIIRSKVKDLKDLSFCSTIMFNVMSGLHWIEDNLE